MSTGYLQKRIPTFVISLKEQSDGQHHITQEFKGKEEFDIHFTKDVYNNRGIIDLWKSIINILSDFKDNALPYLIVCRDDHKFTSNYNTEALLNAIEFANTKEVDILLGGVSWLKGAIPISKDMLWVDSFSGMHFAIIFNRFFKRILETKFNTDTNVEDILSTLSTNKLLLYPFISEQKDSGYSDIPPQLYAAGLLPSPFSVSSSTAALLFKIDQHYKQSRKKEQITPEYQMNEEDYQFTLPTYIINLPSRKDRLAHILEQFKNRPEFDCTIISAISHEVGALGLWLSIREIINLALQRDEDVILICEDDHEFTAHYNRDFLFKNIIESHIQGADYLSGGSGGFSFAIPVTPYRFWVNPCYSTQFTIVYKKFFQKILNEPFDEKVIADILLPSMTGNKMLIFPFISHQHDFGYSDVTPLHQDNKGLITTIFQKSEASLKLHHQVSLKYDLF